MSVVYGGWGSHVHMGVPAISRRFTKPTQLPGHLKVQRESQLPEGFYKELVIPGLYKDEHPP